MDKRDNFQKAMQDMFGLGSGGSAEKPMPEQQESAAEDFFADAPIVEEKKPVKPPMGENKSVTVLGAGSVFEGTLRTNGDVELNGVFKGDVFAEGSVIIHNNIEGNVQAGSIELVSCSVKGDLVAGSELKISENSAVTGNLRVNSMSCAGKIEGNVQAEGSVALSRTARVNGDLSAAALSVESGAAIAGRLAVASKQ